MSEDVGHHGPLELLDAEAERVVADVIEVLLGGPDRIRIVRDHLHDFAIRYTEVRRLVLQRSMKSIFVRAISE
jgi:hypothetical protein